MIKKSIFRLMIMSVILLATCEIGLRIRLAYLYREPGWFLYHQFRLRSQEEINKDTPNYYKDNMFKPFKLVYAAEKPKTRRDIITIESSALRSIRRQLQKMLYSNPNFVWLDYSPSDNKEIHFSNNSIVLYEFFVYPDIYNTLKREARLFRWLFGPTFDDFLYHNLAFYMHMNENLSFLIMDSDKMVADYIRLMSAREEPFCKSIVENRFKNVIYVISPNNFDRNSPAGRVYLKYITAAYKYINELLRRYKVPYIDLTGEDVIREDFKDYFHLSAKGGQKMSTRILEYLDRMEN